MKTILVNSYSGDKEITLEKFVDEWRSHMLQLTSLSWDHIDEFQKMRDRVCEIAEIEFDRIYKIQEMEKQIRNLEKTDV